LNYPLDYVTSTWIEHKLHHTYPTNGGYDDQDALLMDDWRTINQRVNHYFGIHTDKSRDLDLNQIPGAIEESLF
jgi:hypothetical protein